MTNAELAVLGLVAEGPRHGYQVEQDIERRGMREWTEIGFSSIYYVLNRLETAGWLESRPDAAIQPGRRGPQRRVYALTAGGREAYRRAVCQRLRQPRPRSADFALALANLPAVPLEEARAAIAAQQAGLAARLQELQGKLERDRQAAAGLPPHVEALFAYSIAQMAAELAWLAQFLEQGFFDTAGDKP